MGWFTKKRQMTADMAYRMAKGGMTPDRELERSFEKIDDYISYKARCGSYVLALDYENESINQIERVKEHYEQLGFLVEIVTPVTIQHPYLFISWYVN